MKIGTKINGRYQIKALIGSGGMAKVYLARDLILDRDVAVKMLRIDFRDDEAIIRRFQREALSATELDHPNVVAIYDVGEENGLQYIVMEYVKGTDLKQYIRDNYPISFDKVVAMMEQILSAIALAHRHRIIHRDLKPQNILVDSAGNCKITDFGIALALNETSVTQTNTLLGSVHYLSPEQARGGSATEQSDIYALGIILYEMLTGEVPFDGESAVSIALQHFQDEIPSIRKYQPNVPQALENVVLKATAKNPKDRYQTVVEMADDLKTVLDASRANESVWHPNEEEIVTEEDSSIARDDLMQTTVIDYPVPTKKKGKSKKKFWLFLLILLLAIGGCTALFYSGGKNIAIPNVKGDTVEAATQTLEKQGFDVAKKSKEVYSNDVAKGLVVKTSPQSGNAANKGDEITLYISKGKKQVNIKNYIGQNYDEVVKKLTAEGIKENQIKKEMRLSSGYKEGTIMAQTPTNGTIEEGKGEITFVVSSGISGKMANLVGMDLDEVQKYANDNHLSLIVQYEYSTVAEEGEVLSQEPEPNSDIQVGDTIFVTFARKTVVKQNNRANVQNNNQQQQNKQAQNNVANNQNNNQAQNNNNQANVQNNKQNQVQGNNQNNNQQQQNQAVQNNDQQGQQAENGNQQQNNTEASN